MKWLCLVAVMFLFAGCGDVNWFPDSTTTTTTPPSSAGKATGPNAFSFTPKTATIADAGGSIVSDPVTITGDNPNGWTISLADTPSTVNSAVLINGALVLRDLTPNPVIKPGQTLIVEQNVSPIVKAGDKMSTIVTIGTTTAEFVTTVQ